MPSPSVILLQSHQTFVYLFILLSRPSRAPTLAPTHARTHTHTHTHPQGILPRFGDACKQIQDDPPQLQAKYQDLRRQLQHPELDAATAASHSKLQSLGLHVPADALPGMLQQLHGQFLPQHSLDRNTATATTQPTPPTASNNNNSYPVSKRASTINFVKRIIELHKLRGEKANGAAVAKALSKMLETSLRDELPGTPPDVLLIQMEMLKVGASD